MFLCSLAKFKLCSVSNRFYLFNRRGPLETVVCLWWLSSEQTTCGLLERICKARFYPVAGLSNSRYLSRTENIIICVECSLDQGCGSMLLINLFNYSTEF